MAFIPNLEFSPYSEVTQGSVTFKLTKGQQKFKKNDQIIFFIPMSQTISVIKRSGTCYFLHASN